MEKYQIIPRKFRPKLFAEVAGHEAIVTTLKNALAKDQVGQAYLFCGGRGCGKTTLARLFAKALNCTNPTTDHEPCNECVSCQEISNGRSLDIIEIDGASNRGIDDIRQINETVGYAPNKGRYKIYIIDEVHMLTKEAFNALLKTLEEPPKTVKFFFATTEPHKIPQTIISRCQRFNLSRIPQKDLVEKLQRICETLGVETEESALIQISHLSEGSLRDAESLLDQLICFGKTPITFEMTRDVFGLVSTQILSDLDEAILSKNTDRAIELAKELYESGKDIASAIDSFLEHFRLHLSKETFTKQQCLTLLDILIEWQQYMLKTPFKKIHLEMLLLNLVRSAHKISLESLIQRLFELEKNLTSSQESEVELPSQEAKLESALEPPNEIKKDPAPEPPKQEETPKPAPPKQEIPPGKYETLIRFAAVELDGTVNT